MKPKDFKPNDGYWIFNDQKLYLLNGSMMNQNWLIVTELMRKRPDLTDDFLYPYRRKIEKALSIPEQIMEEVDAELAAIEIGFDKQLKALGVRRLRDGEKINKGK